MAEYLDSLFKWLQTFHLPVKPSSVDELLDGIVCAQILNHIAGDFFTTDWLSRLATGSSTDDWRSRESNWRKIVDRLNAFYEEIIGMQLYDQFKPSLRDLSMRGDHQQLANVLRLILGAAVNCEARQTYIQNIVQLELHVQQRLMEAIQQLMQGEPREKSVEKGTSSASNSTAAPIPSHSVAMFDSLNFEQAQKELQTQLTEAVEQLQNIQKRYETLQEKNFELEQALNEEYRNRQQLTCENEQLSDRIRGMENGRTTNDHRAPDHDHHQDHLQNQQNLQRLHSRMEQLERELVQTEMQREECMLRIDLLEKELSQAHANNDQMMRKVKEAEMLKDELDVHRHSADKIANYEQKLEAYKQKLEELLDQRKQFKVIEEKNQQLLGSNAKLESELKKANALKVQVSEYKKQVQELHQQVIEKTHQCDKSDFELQKLNEQLAGLMHEKDRLGKEKLELKALLNHALPATSNSFSLVEELEDLTTEDGSSHLKMPPNLGFELTNESGAKWKDEVKRLEEENRLLRDQLQTDDSVELLLLRTTCEDAKTRAAELEQTNRALNKKIFELESQVERLNRIEDSRAKVSDQQETESKMKELLQTIQKLKQELAAKQDEINEVETKHRKYIERAKKAVNVLEPLSLNIQNHSASGSLMPNFLSVGNCSMPIPSSSASVLDLNALNVDDLRSLLAAKEAQLAESEKHKAILEFENRLITTAFHKFAFDLQRKAATERVQTSGPSTSTFGVESPLSKAPSTSSLSSNGSSLLNKHRQATTRKYNLDRFTNVFRRPSLNGSLAPRRSSLFAVVSPLTIDSSTSTNLGDNEVATILAHDS